MVLFSEDPSTGQNMPQNFCRGLGLPEPRFLKKAGTSSSSAAFPDCFLSAMAWGGLGRVLSVRQSVCRSLSLPVSMHQAPGCCRGCRSLPPARCTERKEGWRASDPPLPVPPPDPAFSPPCPRPPPPPPPPRELWRAAKLGLGGWPLRQRDWRGCQLPAAAGGGRRGRRGGGAGLRGGERRGGEAGRAAQPRAPRSGSEAARPPANGCGTEGPLTALGARVSMGQGTRGRRSWGAVPGPRAPLPDQPGPGASPPPHCGGGPAMRAHRGERSLPLTRGVS